MNLKNHLVVLKTVSHKSNYNYYRKPRSTSSQETLQFQWVRTWNKRKIEIIRVCSYFSGKLFLQKWENESISRFWSTKKINVFLIMKNIKFLISKKTVFMMNKFILQIQNVVSFLCNSHRILARNVVLKTSSSLLKVYYSSR